MHSNSPPRFQLTRVAALAMVAVAASIPCALFAEDKPDITVKVRKQTEAIVPLSLSGQTTQRLILEAEGSLEIKTSYIKFKDDGLWSRTSATKEEHIYRLLNAYSSQEFVHIDGEFVTPKGGGNGGNGLVPEFHVTVPAVDIDWAKVDGKGVVITEANEDKESGSVLFVNQVTAEFTVSKPSEYRDDMFKWTSAEKMLDMRLRWNDSVFNVFENNRLLTSPHEIPWESWPDYKLKDKGQKLIKTYKIMLNPNATPKDSHYPITLTSDNGASDVIYAKTSYVNLSIHNGLEGVSGGQMINEEEEETKGAVTVANLNDTNGNGIVDVLDVVVEKSPAGRDEHDLMRLRIDRPSPITSEKVKIIIVSGNIKLWEHKTKKNQINTTQSSSGKFAEFNASELPKDIWVEACSVSTALRDIKIKAEYMGASDIVSATALWVEHKRALTTRASSGAANELPENLDESTVRNYIMRLWTAGNIAFKSSDGSHYGVGTMAGMYSGDNPFSGHPIFSDQLIGGRILHEFEIFPHNVDSLGVIFDVTRQVESKRWIIGKNKNFFSLQDTRTFPDNQAPKKDIEAPNDDGESYDEDNIPNN
jgi:hypothetical protein